MRPIVDLRSLAMQGGYGLALKGAQHDEAWLIALDQLRNEMPTFEDKARGYGEGADDYVTKPFDLRELRLRCEALARRRSLHQRKTIVLGELEIDLPEVLAAPVFLALISRLAFTRSDSLPCLFEFFEVSPSWGSVA